ncbi:hypothetical protein CK503_14765 [Aliifodinibius salipaludis]|uniref:Uncharacterized protein n=1 Tax=Fodinibius salipaludis TaxID=2032627 RepID=A0A2A2G7X1_9BACT|nr:hypothetical protein [Aliifodinibius salipaludis]PAU92945.1 hypothetical protein CK503_14765 [Aliifodinibius salipaludis]
MGESDPQVLAMWAAILGASAGILSAIVSFFAIYFSRLSSKEQMKTDFKIAEMSFNANVISTNRQNWINQLRSLVSEFIGLGVFIGAALNNPHETNAQEVTEKTERLHTLKGQINLMLNPNEPKSEELSDLVEKFYGSAINNDNPVSSLNLNSIKESIIETLQKILKEEWERVKKGE